MNAARRTAGFTLVEVLVALVIVAFGMSALLATLGSAATTVGALRDKSFAEWVALNRITEVRLMAPPPGVGKTSGEVEFAGEKWRWSQEIVDPKIAGIRRIDVTVARAAAVAAKNESPPSLAQATGFLGLAVAASSGVMPDWSMQLLMTQPPGSGGPPPAPGAGPGTGPAPVVIPVSPDAAR